MGDVTQSRGIRTTPRGARQAWVADNQGQHFCQCGCGQPLLLRVEHYTEGIPMFLLGHNAKASPPNKKPPKPTQLCECGCGEITAAGMRFRSGHNSRVRRHSDETKRKIGIAHSGERSWFFGKKPPGYKGGRIYHQNGYVQKYEPRHPFAVARGYVMEHRLVMEQHLRSVDPLSDYLTEVDGALYLRRDIEVHHVNGVKDDNRVENLELMTKSEHALHHQNLLRG